jgi:hypothetical protein
VTNPEALGSYIFIYSPSSNPSAALVTYRHSFLRSRDEMGLEILARRQQLPVLPTLRTSAVGGGGRETVLLPA